MRTQNEEYWQRWGQTVPKILVNLFHSGQNNLSFRCNCVISVKLIRYHNHNYTMICRVSKTVFAFMFYRVAETQMFEDSYKNLRMFLKQAFVIGGQSIIAFSQNDQNLDPPPPLFALVRFW